jgi:hypothetical protein
MIVKYWRINRVEPAAQSDDVKPPKELLYCWVAGGFSVLVPKKKGEGYLKVPYGHHYIDELTAIADKMRSDVWGLDGALDFHVRGALFHGPESGRVAFSEAIMPLLERYYGFPSREIVVAEFWQLNP